MMDHNIRVGTRSSQLATWQALHVKTLLGQHCSEAELCYIKSEGDIDLKTPLYEMGVQGIFTRTLDAALLSGRIDIAVHSMKDVPTKLPDGIVQVAVLPRATHLDILVQNSPIPLESLANIPAVIATSSTRRKAQWLYRFPHHRIENLRGNVNLRLEKLAGSQWHGAIFAAAGLERVALRPEAAIELDWMLSAPAQGAIVVVCREGDEAVYNACRLLNDASSALCTSIEKDFLRSLRGGCTAPIGALAEIRDGIVSFKGNLLMPDGSQCLEVQRSAPISDAAALGEMCGAEIMGNGGHQILEILHNS